jgi:phosphate transport system protein
MTQLENELLAVKSEVLNLWELVLSQMTKARTAMGNTDRDLARDVISREKRVNALELKIDLDCENIFALLCPVAIDLRFLLAVLKINSNLERAGDFAEGIAKYVVDADHVFDKNLLQKTELFTMFDEAIAMLSDAKTAYENDDTSIARTIFKRDETLDEINGKVIERVAETVRGDVNMVDDGLYILSIIRKLERVGDQVKNIAEEIIFYVEAKVLKHAGKI